MIIFSLFLNVNLLNFLPRDLPLSNSVAPKKYHSFRKLEIGGAVPLLTPHPYSYGSNSPPCMKIQHSCYRDKKNSKKDNTRVNFLQLTITSRINLDPQKALIHQTLPLPPGSGFKQILPNILLQETTVP